jgi:hypothetical protein
VYVKLIGEVGRERGLEQRRKDTTQGFAVENNLGSVSHKQLSCPQMNKLIIALACSALLTACGGGGGSSATSATPVSSGVPTTTTTTTTPPSVNTQVVEAPVPPGSAVNMTARAVSQGGNAQNWLVHFTGAADLTLSGDLNNLWLDAVQAGGSVVVSGKLNTLVFTKDVATTITVTGTANTFYFPLGSAFKLEGSGAASSTIRYYKP